MSGSARLALPAVVALLALGGCGGDDEGDQPSATGFATGSFVGLVDDTSAGWC